MLVILKNNRDPNTDDLISQHIEAVTDTYLNPPENTADENGRVYLNLIAEEFSVTLIKVQKLLMSYIVYQTSISYRNKKHIKQQDG